MERKPPAERLLDNPKFLAGWAAFGGLLMLVLAYSTGAWPFILLAAAYGVVGVEIWKGKS